MLWFLTFTNDKHAFYCVERDGPLEIARSSESGIGESPNTCHYGQITQEQLTGHADIHETRISLFHYADRSWVVPREYSSPLHKVYMFSLRGRIDL